MSWSIAAAYAPKYFAIFSRVSNPLPNSNNTLLLLLFCNIVHKWSQCEFSTLRMNDFHNLGPAHSCHENVGATFSGNNDVDGWNYFVMS